MSSVGITAVPGISVGQYTDVSNATGCTVVLCEDGAAGGVDVRGSAPGTRETDLLSPTAMVDSVHAVTLTGGSAFGLDAATGVMRCLEQKGVGLPFGGEIIPIVPAAVLFDLGLSTGSVRPGASAGRTAALAASRKTMDEGSVGAGTGATVGKLLGRERCIKGGIGTADIELGGGLIIGATVAVNAIGGVVDPDTGRVVAGPLDEDGKTMLDSMKLITTPGFRGGAARSGENTTIGVVATNAALTKPQASKLASSAHDGIAMAVRPAHLMGDGDTLFALGTRKYDGDFDMNRLCAAAALCVSRAVMRAVLTAVGIGGVKSVSELSA